MTGPVPYLFFPGNAAEALAFYREIFGGDLALHSYAEFDRHDGPGDSVAHGVLSGPVRLFAADAGADEDAVHIVGATFALFDVAEAPTLTRWFDELADGGSVTEELQERPWGDYDGQVTDRYGIRWLIGFRA